MTGIAPTRALWKATVIKPCSLSMHSVYAHADFRIWSEKTATMQRRPSHTWPHTPLKSTCIIYLLSEARVCERSERPDASSVKGNSYQTLLAFYALYVRSHRLQNIIREDRNNVEKTVTNRKSHIIYLSSVRGQIHVQWLLYGFHSVVCSLWFLKKKRCNPSQLLRCPEL